MFGNKKKTTEAANTAANDATKEKEISKTPNPPLNKTAVTQDTVFAKNINFNRESTPEEKAQKAGVYANTANLAFLTVFGALSGMILLFISIYLSHLEAVNAAIIIKREGQYWISLGLSFASAIFSVIGFQYLTRWWKYKDMAEFLPTLVQKSWTADPKRKVLYDILIRILVENRKQSGVLGLIFLALNTICSSLVLWATISAMDETVNTSAWIYTVSISVLAFLSGACISLITNADVNEKYVISLAQGRYMDYAEAQASSDIVNGDTGK